MAGVTNYNVQNRSEMLVNLLEVSFNLMCQYPEAKSALENTVLSLSSWRLSSRVGIV